MATGQRAFAETQAGRLMDAILHTAPVAPTRFQPRLSGELERIILKCLEKEPEDRYQSAKEVEVDLRRLKRDTDSGRAAVAGAGGLRAATKKRWKVLAPAAALVAVLAGAAVWQFRSAHALTEEDFILLTDFTNTTGDSVFDGTLKQALAVKLQESPFLNVFPERRVRQTLARMERAPDQRLTPALGEEICQREGIKAMLTGEIAPLGSHYVVTLNAMNCLTGDSLAREQVEAASKEEVLGALGQAGSRLRAKLGESLSSIEAYDTPLAQATTSSLEALKAYTLGYDQALKGAEAESIPFFQRALELDPNFALAYSRLGTIYGNLGETDIASEYKKKAFELRGRVSERERFYISSHYYFTATGELERAIEIYNLWKQAYPRHDNPHINLAATYENLGQFEKAVEEDREALRLAPDIFHPYLNLGWHLSALNRFDEARKVFEESIARNLDVVETHTALYLIAFFQGDAATMQEEVERAAGKPDEYRMRQLQATTVATTGKLRESRELYRQAVELAQRHNFSESAALIAAAAALMEANHGNSRQAREKAAEALSIARSRNAKALAAIALARAGAVKQAQALIDELEKRYPKDTLVNLIWAPTARAAVELQRGNAEKAIEVLRPAAPYERAHLETIYVRGRAHLQAQAGSEAAAEFLKILDLKGVWNWTISLSRPHALAQLGLARAYALAGDTTQSRRAYEDFFSLWKDADPDIPILLEAKSEYAKL
jgi:tetratricopeptide (TPR) repeat protein